MNEMRSGLLATAAAFMVVFGLAACAGETQESSEGSAEPGMAAEAGEHSEGGEGRERARESGEGEGEHGEAREGREGGEGEHGEAREGHEGGEGEHREGREGGESEHGGEGGDGEHGGEGGHEEGEEGEEPGIYIDKGETWDMTRRGARLVLSFDATADAFMGQVENTTGQTLCAVRVEVHLAGGPELGPTTRTDVPAGGTTTIRLPAEGASFETWTAHPELSRCSG